MNNRIFPTYCLGLVIGALVLASCSDEAESDGSGGVIQVSGKTLFPALSGATLTAHAGEQTLTTTTDAQGRYSLALPRSWMDGDVLWLEVTGTYREIPVRMDALLGTSAEVRALASGDDELSDDDSSRVNLTPVSTAEMAQLRARFGENLAISDNGPRTVDPQFMLQTASALQLITSDEHPETLSDEFSDTAAFASDVAAVLAFVDAIYDAGGAERFRAVERGFIDRPGFVERVRERPTTALLRLLGQSDDFNRVNVLRAYSLEADGGGDTYSASHDSQVTWSQGEGGEFVVSFAQSDSLLSEGTTYFWTESALFPFRPDRVQSRDTYEYQAPDRQLAVLSTVVTNAGWRYLSDNGVYADFQQSINIEVDDYVAVPIFEYTGSGSFYPTPEVNADLLWFATETTGIALLSERSFSWERLQDAIFLVFDDGTTATYRGQREVDECASRWMADLRGPQGERRLDVVSALCGIGIQAFQAETVPGMYYQFGRGDEQQPHQPQLKGFALRFDPDGTGSHVDDYIAEDSSGASVVVTVDDSTDPASRFHWSALPDGRLRLKRYRNTATETGGCAPSEEDCAEYDRRDITLINTIEGRYYWIETRQIGAPNDADEGSANAARYYDKLPTSSTKRSVSDALPSPTAHSAERLDRLPL